MPFIRLREGWQNEPVFRTPDPMPTVQSFNTASNNRHRTPMQCYACGSTNITRHYSVTLGYCVTDFGYDLHEYATSLCRDCEITAMSYVELPHNIAHSEMSGADNWRPWENTFRALAPFKWMEVVAAWERQIEAVVPGLDDEQKLAYMFYALAIGRPSGVPRRFYFNNEVTKNYLARYRLLPYSRCSNRNPTHSGEQCSCFVDAAGRWSSVCSMCRVGTRDNRCACVRPQRWNEIWIRSPLEFIGEEGKTPKRYIGVEFELAGGEYRHKPRDFANAAKVLGCTIKMDGSLPEYGIELITPPARGKAFRKLMKNLDTIFKSFDCIVSNSCGGHVHVDATGFHMEDGPLPAAKLMALWAKLEPALMAGTCSSRRRGTYCRPWKLPRRRTVGKWVRGIERGMEVYRRNYDERPHNFFVHDEYGFAGGRYQGMNLQAYHSHRTVEFRHWDGTASGTEAWMRGYIGDKILCAARDWSPEKVDALASIEDGLEVVQAVAGKRAANYIKELQGRCGQMDRMEDPDEENPDYDEDDGYEPASDAPEPYDYDNF